MDGMLSVTFSCRVLGAQKAYGWIEPGLRFAGRRMVGQRLWILARE